jgi:membrane protein
MQRLIAIVLLMITTFLVVIATLAAGLTSLIGNVPLGLPMGPVLGKVLGWSVSIISLFLFFMLIYKILPNARQGWRDVMPGTLLSSVLLLVISQIFPLYVALFPPNHAYAVFGVFLVFTFWLYLLGFVLVLGAELNAFLQEPSTQPLEAGGATEKECRTKEDHPEVIGFFLGVSNRAPLHRAFIDR